jgi:hypothetical protein
MATEIIRALIGPPGDGWKRVTRAEMKKWTECVQISITRDTPQGRATLFTAYRPPRHRDETPIQYYKRTKCVDDHHFHVHKGWYYCNPAHCKRRWRNKTERDRHAVGAYGALGD